MLINILFLINTHGQTLQVKCVCYYGNGVWLKKSSVIFYSR